MTWSDLSFRKITSGPKGGWTKWGETKTGRPPAASAVVQGWGDKCLYQMGAGSEERRGWIGEKMQI